MGVRPLYTPLTYNLARRGEDSTRSCSAALEESEDQLRTVTTNPATSQRVAWDSSDEVRKNVVCMLIPLCVKVDRNEEGAGTQTTKTHKQCRHLGLAWKELNVRRSLPQLIFYEEWGQVFPGVPLVEDESGVSPFAPWMALWEDWEQLANR